MKIFKIIIEKLKTPFHVFNINGIIEGGVNFASVIFLFGGILVYQFRFIN